MLYFRRKGAQVVPERPGLLPLLLTAILLLPCAARGQINTESMRRDESSSGFGGEIGVNLALQRGNTEFLRLGATGRVDHAAWPWYTFLVGSYERGTKSEELFANNAFAHVRGVYALDTTWRFEAFAQREFNEFLRLNDRLLGGAGVRVGLLDLAGDSSQFRAILGVGGMYEVETLSLDRDTTTRILRSTNYLSLTWRLPERLTLSTVTYVQPAFARLHDVRLIVESSLRIRLVEHLSFNAILAYRLDNEPPPDVRRYDLRLTNGLAINW